LLFGAVLVIAAWRTWLADRPPVTQCWTALALGAAAGLAFGRMVIARLRHHAADGPLAVAALHSPSRWCYVAIIHLAATMTLAAIVTIARPGLIAWSLAAYLLGAAIAHTAPAFDIRQAATARFRRRVALIGGLYRAAGIAELAFAAAIIASTTLPPVARMVAIGVAAALPMLLLTMVDDVVVRFMALAGHGVAATIGRHARAGTLFAVIAASIALATAGLAAAALALSIGAIILAWLALRVILYRLYARRLADLLLIGIAAVVALIATSLPIVLPVVATILVWRLWRRSAERDWIIA
jgi:hypothetical protein